MKCHATKACWNRIGDEKNRLPHEQTNQHNLLSINGGLLNLKQAQETWFMIRFSSICLLWFSYDHSAIVLGDRSIFSPHEAPQGVKLNLLLLVVNPAWCELAAPLRVSGSTPPPGGESPSLRLLWKTLKMLLFWGHFTENMKSYIVHLCLNVHKTILKLD